MAISELNLLIRRCIHRRVSPTDLNAILKQYSLQTTYTKSELIASVLNAAINFCMEADPILPQYLQSLLLHNSISLPDLIIGMIQLWKTKLPKAVPVEVYLISNLNLTTISQSDNEKSISLVSRWLNALIQTDKIPLVEAVGFFLTNLINPLLSKTTYAQVQQVTDRCMTTFPSVAMQLMNKMSSIPKPIDQPITDVASYQFEANIQDGQIVPVRAATTVYLYSHLYNLETIDDSVVVSFLNTRYQGNQPLMFNELVYATIEAMLKSADDLYQSQCQLFLLDKLPFILAFIASSALEGFSSETILNEASISLDPDVAKKFLQICSFHHLTPPQENNTLKGLYAKEGLVNQVVANHSRGPRLVEELLKKDGNAANISQAIAEIMHNYCLTKDTQHLKDMSNAIVRRPASINTIGLFIKPAIFLTPLCLLLDEWKWDEIHGESQPMYDEFGSIFLLVVAFKQRLGCDIPSKGFLSRYFALKHSELPEPKYLGDWIQSLYIDEALSDDLTSRCSAQEFYLLVPTLMRQSVLARSKGKLTNTTFNAGLEYLLESFLLPSLIPALGWVDRIAETEPEIAKLVLQVLTKESSSAEAKETHQTILSMAASQLEQHILDPALSTMVASMKFATFTLMPETSDFELSQVVSQVGQNSYKNSILDDTVKNHGPVRTVQTLINVLIQFSGTQEFHSVLDFEATIISRHPDLTHSLQVMRATLSRYLKKGDTITAEAIVHLSRRVELYVTALAAQDLAMDHNFGSMTGINMTNLNLDAGPAASFEQIEQNEDIDQVLNEAVAMGGIDNMNSNSFDDMYGFQAGDLGLDNLDNLDLDIDNMF